MNIVIRRDGEIKGTRRFIVFTVQQVRVQFWFIIQQIDLLMHNSSFLLFLHLGNLVNVNHKLSWNLSILDFATNQHQLF
jgi:hypothetical protein